MKTLLNHLLREKQSRKWTSVALTVFVAILLTLLAVYGLGDYGVALFIFLPVFMGVCSVVLYGKKESIKFGEAIGVSSLTVFVYALCLLLFALEGAICLLMAAPLGFLLAWLGAAIGHLLLTKNPGGVSTAVWLLLAAVPTVSFVEKNNTPELTAVVTSVEIDADAATVWKNVIQFPQLEEPEEWLFKAGIAYPVNAQIKGSGVGAVRHCNFTTGSFVEPITVWDEGRLLKFDVAAQPEPMKELSFRNVHPPHLQDYFVSKKGQFKLISLPNGKVRLEGTTWYLHKLRPALYWRLWSDYILHKIHLRVLRHIKETAERQTVVL